MLASYSVLEFPFDDAWFVRTKNVVKTPFYPCHKTHIDQEMLKKNYNGIEFQRITS
jgi:hypothetical protein